MPKIGHPTNRSTSLSTLRQKPSKTQGKASSLRPRPTALGVHIFAGGFTCGVKKAGFNVLAHLEADLYGVATAKANWPDLDVRVGEEVWQHEEFIGVDFIYANPPCAIFSTAAAKKQGSWKTDPRTNCWHSAFKVFTDLKPKVFVMESVCQAYTNGRELVDNFTNSAITIGYSVRHVLMDAKWTGIPQSRKRFFFVCYRPWAPLHLGFSFVDPPTVGEVLSTVNDPGRSYSCAFNKWIEKTPEGGKLRNTYQEAYNNPTNEVLNGNKIRMKGRPGFLYQKLHRNRIMGAFIGAHVYAHYSENRFMGMNEARAVCGYPVNFIVERENTASVHETSLLLSRAVLPPVGEWIARAALTSISSPVIINAPPTVTMLDLRKRPGFQEDITSLYFS